MKQFVQWTMFWGNRSPHFFIAFQLPVVKPGKTFSLLLRKQFVRPAMRL